MYSSTYITGQLHIFNTRKNVNPNPIFCIKFQASKKGIENNVKMFPYHLINNDYKSLHELFMLSCFIFYLLVHLPHPICCIPTAEKKIIFFCPRIAAPPIVFFC